MTIEQSAHPMFDAVDLHSDAPLPDGFAEAFWRYDSALLINDVAELDALFEDSEHTVRADASGVLCGYAAISDFRSARSDRPTRRVTRLWVRVLAGDLVYCTAEVRSGTGSTGLQTQLWRRDGGIWRVGAAHVTAPSKAIENTVWRVAGAPLVAGAGAGPMRGHTIAVKDLISVAGVARAAGVRAYLAESSPAAESAAVVGQLLAAGAAVAGVAHTDQFAFGLAGVNADFGTPTNLAAPTRIPGGSSSGSAAAVRCGWASIGLGTDTAGSIRVPASYQGLWGFRPSHGAVSTEGVLPLAPSFDTVGWITRDAATLRTVGDVLLPAAHAAPISQWVWSSELTDLADLAVRTAVRSAAGALGARELPPLPDRAAWTAAFRVIQAHEAWAGYSEWITAHPDALGADVADRFAAGREVSEDQLTQAWATVRAARQTMAGLLADSCLVLPTVGSAAPRINAGPAEIDAHRRTALSLTTLASLAGLPAVSAPVLTMDGAPVGLSLVAGPGRDRDLLELADELSRRLGEIH